MGYRRDPTFLNSTECYRRRVDIIWSRKTPVGSPVLVDGSVAASAKSRCLARVVSVRVVSSMASETSVVARS